MFKSVKKIYFLELFFIDIEIFIYDKQGKEYCKNMLFFNLTINRVNYLFV